MQTKYKVIIVVVSLAGAFASGRFLTPEKVKIETKIVEVEKKTDKIQEHTDESKHKQTTVVQVSKPDGTKTQTTTITEDTHVKQGTDTTTSSNINISDTTDKQTTKSSSRLTVSALVGATIPNLANPAPTVAYGLQIQRDLIGPVNIGLFGLSTGTIGLSIGLVF